MAEYVSTTVELMMATKPNSVLDIGCGTGMPLLRVAPKCRRYVGLDPSEHTMNNLTNAVEQAKLAQVTLMVGEATETDKFAGEDFDIAVCNSVSQHFSGLDYLARVLNAALDAVREGGTVIFGDIRDFSLELEFQSEVVCTQAHENTPRDVLAARVMRRRTQERELMVDPRWFALEVSNRTDVTLEVRPRRGYCQNETTAYHYDVVLHKGSDVEGIKLDKWLDWRCDQFSLDQLAGALADGAGDFGIREIPNARTQQGIAFAKKIFGGAAERGGQAAINGVDQSVVGIQPDDVVALADTHGYQCHISRASAHAGGAFDIAVIRPPYGHADGRRRLPIFKDPVARGSTTLSTDPRRYHRLTMARTTLIPALRRYSTAQFDQHDRPAAYVVVPDLPMKAGRLDIEALPLPRSPRAGQTSRPEWWIPGDGHAY
jgi:SAM-dependent methyltransferase